MTNIIVVHPQCDPNKIKIQTDEKQVVWLSFGEKYNDISKFETAFRREYQRLNIATLMEEHYLATYKIYSDIVAEIDLKYIEKYPEWWLSPISEKNGWPPKAVRNICFLNCIRSIYQKKEYDQIIVVTSSKFVANNAKKMVHQNDEFSVYGSIYYTADRIKFVIRSFAEFVYFGYDSLKLINDTRSLDENYSYFEDKKTVLLRTYCHESSLKDDGSFEDTKFGTLKLDLESKGYNVVFQLNLSSISDKKKVYRWINEKAIDKHWVLEKYIGLSDIGKAYLHIIKQTLLLSKMQREVRMNLDPLFVLTTGRNYLKSLVPLKLKKRREEPNYIIYNWENKTYEKYMEILIKKNLPTTKTRGYLNAIPFPTGPEVNLSEKEAKITPLPDILVCCSQYVYDWIKQTGYDEKRLLVGPSIRQTHVFSDVTSTDEFILVALPLNYELSIELFKEIVSFARENKEYNILLKPHPYLEMNKILEVSEPITENLTITNENIGDLLKKCHIFIFTGPTTTACEAFVLGKMIIRFVSNNNYSMDCLFFGFNKNVSVFTEYKEMETLIRDKDKHRHVYLSEGKKYNKYIFNNDVTNFVNLFVD